MTRDASMQDLKDMMQESRQAPEVTVENLRDGEYVRAYMGMGGSTVISGMIQGVTFSLDVPEQLDDESAAQVAHATITAIRENVFLNPIREPGQAVGRPAGHRA